MKQEQQSYIDLNEYTSFFSHYKREKSTYHCPVCDGKLSISRSNGQKFTCYGGGCQRKDIRKAVLEMAGETPRKEYFSLIRKKRQRERQEAEALRIAKLKTETQRNKDWEQITNNLSLSDRHRHEMIDRGWSKEWIERSKARSSAKGRVVPILTADGLMVGSQVILDGGGKAWYGQAGTHHLRETGELPLTVIYPPSPRSGIVALVESTLDKPGLTAQNFNLVTIGSSNIGSQPKDLERSITMIKRRMGWDSVQLVLMADAGMLSNNAVLSNYRRLKQQVEALGYKLLVGWWGQVDKSDGDIDEISPNTPIEKISFDRFEEIVKKHNGLLHRFFSQFRPKKERVKPQPVAKFDRDAIKYTTPEEHRTLLKKVIDEGKKIVLDTTYTGGFKSTTAATIPDYGLDGVEKFLYVTSTHRNPTTLEVETNFEDFPSRHSKLYINPHRTTPNGKPHIQTTQPKGATWETIPGNCHQAKLHHVLGDKGYDLNGDDNPICIVCPQLNACHHAIGAGYGFKHAKSAAIEKKNIRIHPQSLPHPESFDYSRSLLIFDDEKIKIEKIVEASVHDFNATLALLAVNKPEILVTISPIISKLNPLFTGEKRARFGFGHKDIVEGIGKIDPTILDLVANATAPNFAELVQDVDGIDTSGMTAAEKKSVKSIDKMMAAESKKENHERLESMPSNWLLAMLEVIINGEGYIRFNQGTLIIAQPDYYHKNIIQKSKLTIILDATGSKEELAKTLEISPDEITVIGKHQPSYTNLTIKQVVGMGTPRKDQLGQTKLSARLDALVQKLREQHTNLGIIAPKREDDRGLWFADSRGVNTYKDCDALLLIGSPCQNLGSLAAEFSILYGRQVEPKSEDPEYRAFVSRRIAAETIQAIGRLRSHLAPGEEKTVYWVAEREDLPTDLVLTEFPGCKFDVVEAMDITVAAGKWEEQLKYWASTALMKIGRIPTQQELAEIIGTSQGNLNKMLKKAGASISKLFHCLLDNLYRVWNNLEDIPPSLLARWEMIVEPEDVEFVTSVVLSEDTDREYKVSELTKYAQYLTTQRLEALIGLMKPEVREKMLDLLLVGFGQLCDSLDVDTGG